MQRRRNAAAIQQQNRLPPALCDGAEFGQERRRERIPRFAAKIDDTHRRQRAGEPSAQLEPLELPPALGSRRRAAEHRHRTFERGAFRRDRARVVPRVGLLLVRGVVLLVDADHAEVPHRREHS